MYFDYSWYVRGCLTWPGIRGLVCLLFLTTDILWCIRQILRKKLTRDMVISSLLSILIVGFMLYLNAGILCNGGIYLLHEKESDAVEMRGDISAIRDAEEAEGYDFPKFSSGPVIQCTINDIKCIAIDTGSLQVGDYVLVRYLPKSRYVLYIDKIDGEKEATITSPY